MQFTIAACASIKMNNLISNLINGNLQDAKRQARRYSMETIIEVMRADHGWTWEKAFCAARWLKTGSGWQDYCDAE